ncbi:GATA transcription factor 8-like isoform X1 [Primulina huaijiensis]|uniref:GATA transcription factor 8-like isoform X1 n=1 Tax=Primulina huaijiensis TaxID=1492673 RepID=UPI003CC714DF
MESNFMDEIDCTAFFEQIDDLIKFPTENESGGVNFETSCDSKDIPSMWNCALPEKTSRLFSGSRGTPPPDLSAELFVPDEDIVQLEWLSKFVEESFSGGGSTMGKEVSCINNGPLHNHFQSPSPVSILDSSSSSSGSFPGEKTTPPNTNHHGTQRARTKRPHPATSNAGAAIQLISPASSFTELPPAKKVLKPVGLEPNREKKTELTLPAKPTDAYQDPPPLPVRKCLHCEITKTPQWRAGPMGPKTLCNACGVRHKSGRLFPEYRPAASPKFVPSLHSNCHKKVMEMRRNVVPKHTATTKTTTASTTTLFAPKLDLVTDCLP